LASGTYRLFNYTGTLTDNGLVIGSLPAGTSATLDVTTDKQVNLNVVVTPATPVTIINPDFAGGQFRLAFASENGRTYTVQYNNDLNSTNWMLLEQKVGDGTTQIITDTNPNPDARYYRVIVD